MAHRRSPQRLNARNRSKACVLPLIQECTLRKAQRNLRSSENSSTHHFDLLRVARTPAQLSCLGRADIPGQRKGPSGHLRIGNNRPVVSGGTRCLRPGETSRRSRIGRNGCLWLFFCPRLFMPHLLSPFRLRNPPGGGNSQIAFEQPHCLLLSCFLPRLVIPVFSTLSMREREAIPSRGNPPKDE